MDYTEFTLKEKDGVYSLYQKGWIIGSTDKAFVDNHRGEQLVKLLDEDECKKAMDILDKLYPK